MTFRGDARLLSPCAPEALHRIWTAHGGDKRLTVIGAGHAGDTGWCLVAYAEGDAAGDGRSLNLLSRDPGGACWICHGYLAADLPPPDGRASAPVSLLRSPLALAPLPAYEARDLTRAR